MDSRRLKITADRRTSLIVDPPDGRMPPLVPLTPERQKARADRAAVSLASTPACLTDRRSCRCRCGASFAPTRRPICRRSTTTTSRSSRVPATSSSTPEMIHSARIIPLDGRPHLGKGLRQWLGDTRGRFDGNTLVIETTNFRDDDGVIFQGANAATYRITERFTRVAEDAINYEFTIEDPTTWTKPWTAVIPWTKIDPGEQMYEYACHEDNYDIVHLLAGARARQKNGETR